MEKWKEVEAFPGYEVSDEGRVRTTDRRDALGRRVRGRLLRLNPSGNGYLHTTLYLGGERKVIKVHHLVLEAFVGPRPKPRTEDRRCANGLLRRLKQKFVGDHLNGVTTDNRAKNLEWVTNGENIRRGRRGAPAPKVERGDGSCRGSRRGELNHKTKLTAKQVSKIPIALRLGWTQKRIADRLGVRQSTIKRIVRGITWKGAAA